MSTNYSRVVSGMRPTGNLHLGHYHGVLKNWVKLQQDHECFFFIADWPALTTEYADTKKISSSINNTVIDWLASGVDHEKATIFIQSHVPEHAELNTLLSMITPLSWLERVPTYKGQQEKLNKKDLSTYGFLGYPLLQSADILIYNADLVPVGEDQVAHIELTREIARHFNYLYGREDDFEEKAQQAAQKMGKKNAKLYHKLKLEYQEKGSKEALIEARKLITSQGNINSQDQNRLISFLEGGGKTILLEPQPLLTKTSKMPGLDGQKMSKSYNNTISLKDDISSVADKIRKMPTDPARIRRNDAGNPQLCPVWQYHEIYSTQETKDKIQDGCTSASIGCLDCKKIIIEPVCLELEQIQNKAQKYTKDPELIKHILDIGAKAAREQAQKTMDEVRAAMGLKY